LALDDDVDMSKPNNIYIAPLTVSTLQRCRKKKGDEEEKENRIRG
jgi:hypothetical protein